MKRIAASVLALSIGISALFAQTDNIPVRVINGKQYYQYEVQAKETIYGISRRFGITQEELIALNPFLVDGMKIGQMLVIPVCPAPASAVSTASDSSATVIEPNTATPSPSPVEPQSQTSPESRMESLRESKADTGQTADAYHPDRLFLYKVTQRRESLTSIAQRFNNSLETLRAINPNAPETLSRGSLLYILLPAPDEDLEVVALDTLEPQPADTLPADTLETEPRRDLRFALLLPLHLDDTTALLQSRYIDFYEGVLMAADTLKRMGISSDIEVYDIGSTPEQLEKVLTDNHLHRMDFLLAAGESAQIDYLSQWTSEYKVPVVLPFSSKIPQVADNELFYQVNPPARLVQQRLLGGDTTRYQDYNLLFIRSYTAQSDDRSHLFNTFRLNLRDRAIPFKEVVEYENTENFADTVAHYLRRDKPNLLILPPCSLNESNRLLAVVGSALNFLPSAYKVEVRGYPDWVAVNRSNLPLLHSLNTTIYGSYYADFRREDLRKFKVDYARYFGKDLQNTYPGYPMLGYDTVLQFGALCLGREIPVQPLQHRLHFTRENNRGGWYNQTFYLVHYRREGLFVDEIR